MPPLRCWTKSGTQRGMGSDSAFTESMPKDHMSRSDPKVIIKEEEEAK